MKKIAPNFPENDTRAAPKCFGSNKRRNMEWELMKAGGVLLKEILLIQNYY